MKVDLHGKVAAVTGAAQGIGQAIANTLAENGATVVYTDVKPCTPRDGSIAMTLNVTDEAQVEQVTADIVRKFGRIDILVNNAGVNTMAHRVTIDAFPKSEWDRLINVDLTGLYLVSKSVTRVMKEQRSGRVVNISSVVGLVPMRLQCAFAAAKAGVVNLTKAMAIELGASGICTNCVAPGSILTEGTRQLMYGENAQFKESVQKLIDHIPLGRPGEVEDIAHAVLYLASPASGYVNGAILTVDGGWTAGYARDF